MKKRIYIIISVALLCSLILLGCRNNNRDKIETDIGTTSVYSDHQKDTVIPIYNAKDQVIGSISAYTYSTLIDNSILYTKCLEEKAVSSYDIRHKLEYRLYDIETGEDRKLGTIDDQSYTADHLTAAIDNHLYMSVSTGDFELENRKQTIYDIDLTKYDMTPILEIEGGLSHNPFTIVDNTLILVEILDDGSTDIIKLNLAEAREEAPVVHAYNEQDYFTKDPVRHITADENHIYMIRLQKDENKNTSEKTSLSPYDLNYGATTELENHSLYMDTYDHELNLLDTTYFDNVCDKENRSEMEIENERRVWGQNFIARDSYMFYKNFSAIDFLGTINNGNINRLMQTDLRFELVQAAKPCANDLFLLTGNFDRTRRNHFYLADPKTGKIQQAEFYTDDVRYYFLSASRNDKGMILLTMGRDRMTNEESCPDKLYWLNMNDLEFTPCSETPE